MLPAAAGTTAAAITTTASSSSASSTGSETDLEASEEDALDPEEQEQYASAAEISYEYSGELSLVPPG